MTALIWILAWLPHVLSARGKLPEPVNVTLTSIHFNHVLRWERGPGTPTGVYYSVTVKTDTGTSWVPVAGCKHVQHPLVCNLAEAFPDKDRVYFTRIQALLEAQVSEPFIQQGFKPIKDSHLDLPLLTVTPCGKELCVDLQPPMEHLREIYDTLHYKLRIESNNSDRGQFFRETKSLRREILKDLASGRKYCVSVCFSDSDVPRKSNYSQPVCVKTPGNYPPDPWISAMLCLLVMSGVIVVVCLVSTGSICLRRRPLPSVLASIHHIEEDLVVTPRSTSLSSFLNLKPTPPSSGEKRSNHTSKESDGESVTESAAVSRGGYKLRVGSNLLSSSSSSSSSLSAPLIPDPEPSSNQTSDVFDPQPEPLISTETHSNSGWKEPLSTRAASHPPSMSDQCSTVGTIQPNEEEEGKMVGVGGSHGVNLLTLTFGSHGSRGEEEEKSHLDMAVVAQESFCALEMHDTIPTLLSQTRDTEEVAIETVSCSVEEDEEEEHFGYIGRL